MDEPKKSRGKKRATPPSDEAILAGLRKALTGSMLLTGTKGLYDANAQGKAAAEVAKHRGYVKVTETKTIPAKGSSKEKIEERCELTDKGRRWLGEADNPTKLLESLRPSLEALVSGAAVDPDVFKAKLDQATASCTKAITTGFEKLQRDLEQAIGKLTKTVTEALPKNSTPAVDLTLVLDALAEALKRFQPKELAESLDQEIVQFVETVGTDGRGAKFNEVMDHLRPRFPTLTVGEFHDVLRRLAEQKRIHLTGWNKAHEDMPKPELALFVSSKVMYHAAPASFHS